MCVNVCVCVCVCVNVSVLVCGYPPSHCGYIATTERKGARIRYGSDIVVLAVGSGGAGAAPAHDVTLAWL
jgi:hypothetical protein